MMISTCSELLVYRLNCSKDFVFLMHGKLHILNVDRHFYHMVKIKELISIFLNIVFFQNHSSYHRHSTIVNNNNNIFILTIILYGYAIFILL